MEQETRNDKGKEPEPVATPKIDWDKKIVKNATLTAEVKNYKNFVPSLSQKVSK